MREIQNLIVVMLDLKEEGPETQHLNYMLDNFVEIVFFLIPLLVIN